MCATGAGAGVDAMGIVGCMGAVAVAVAVAAVAGATATAEGLEDGIDVPGAIAFLAAAAVVEFVCAC